MEPQNKILKMAFNVDDDDLIAETQMREVEIVSEVSDSKIDRLERKIDEQARKLDEQAREIAACTNQLAKLTALLEVFVKGKASSNAVNMEFPIATDEALAALEFALGRGMKEKCTTAVTNLLKRGALTKSLKYIFVEDLIVNYNIDGASGKRRLKSFPNFYGFLIDSISMVDPGKPPEKLLGHALTAIKNNNNKKKIKISK
ncbi:uncharacterized protein [Drosophila bipectinata]|uniref:uncharacterized protein n=1 Tax=Drosophila bipectinata TaxID=42026 RepID=UPI0038B40C1E